MNDAKTFTKILLAAIGLFFLIPVVPQLFSLISILFVSFSWQSFAVMLISMLICGVFILLIWYFFFYLREWFAEKIVAVPTSSKFVGELPWFPVAMRLACVFAGLYCLSRAVFNLTAFIRLVQWYIERDVISNAIQSPVSEVIRLSLLLVIGIYLVCGAPHFVRWQVWKTTEQCRKFESSESASGS
jgi:hypothetical protein